MYNFRDNFDCFQEKRSVSGTVLGILGQLISMKVGKSTPKMFTLRNIDCSKITSCEQLKNVIKTQWRSDIVGEEFDVGFVSDNNVISIRDVLGLWSEIFIGNKVLLWYDRLKLNPSDGGGTSKKRKS